ncbi:hypothetical protein HK101_001098 [Irineochytrium annulatum]|nr:hypothetical protein HK101_001098 [Irineochytrium annulatum]
MPTMGGRNGRAAERLLGDATNRHGPGGDAPTDPDEDAYTAVIPDGPLKFRKPEETPHGVNHSISKRVLHDNEDEDDEESSESGFGSRRRSASTSMSSVSEVRVKKSRLGIIMLMGGIKEKYRSLGEQMIDILTPGEISVMSSLQARQMQDELDNIRRTQALAEEKVGGFVTEWISYYKGFRSFTKFSEARMLGWVKGSFPQELDKNSVNTFRIANGRDGCVTGVMIFELWKDGDIRNGDVIATKLLGSRPSTRGDQKLWKEHALLLFGCAKEYSDLLPQAAQTRNLKFKFWNYVTLRSHEFYERNERIHDAMVQDFTDMLTAGGEDLQQGEAEERDN